MTEPSPSESAAVARSLVALVVTLAVKQLRHIVRFEVLNPHWPIACGM